MEGPKVPTLERGAKHRSAEGEGWVWGVAPWPLPIWGSGAMPAEIFSKINFEIAYFTAFLQTEMVSSAVSARLSITHYNCYGKC